MLRFHGRKASGWPRFSELDFVRFFSPRLVDGAGLLLEFGLLDHRDDLALIQRTGKLFIESLVTEADGAGIVHRQDVVTAINACPKHARHAHAARSPVGIELAAA